MDWAAGTQRLAAALQAYRGLYGLLLAALMTAWLLTKTSASLMGNLPLALLAVATARWVLAALDRAQRARQWDAARGPGPRAWRQEAPPSSPAPTFGVAPGGGKPEAWRKLVRAPVVEEAWARFAGSILQEWIYDCWYGSLTPDREFPAEVRRLLNTAFGQLAVRARTLDLRLVMNDLCELFMEQLELYRDTRESIVTASQLPATSYLRDMSPAARERALQREMRAEGNLHPALQTPDGHYRYLKAVSEGVVAHLLDMSDLHRPAARVMCRELLASCVFRPLMMWATPYYANKGLYAFLKEQAAQKRTENMREAEEVSAALASARSEAMRGHFEFEQRLLSSVAAEDTALTAARQLRHQLRSKLSQGHARSRSVGNLSLSPSKAAAEEQQQRQEEQLGGAQAPAAASSQQHLPPHLRQHQRARSCSPGDFGLAADKTTPAAVGLEGASGGGAQRGRLAASSSSQLRPPRPPAASTPPQQEAGQQQEGPQYKAAAAAPAQQQEKEAERSPFDVFNVASAVASVLLPGMASSRQLQQQQQAGGAPGADRRRPAESDELGLLEGLAEGDGDGDGWEAVDASDATFTLPARDFSSAHLLAPVADQRGVASITPRATSSSSGGGGGGQRAGFAGRARAKVVAADLNTSGSKDYVEFKVRVADDEGEWTVSRRYRNFESLHRQLKCYPCYRLRLPPKRIFIHSNSVEFVEERREALDRYLQALLAHDQLSQCSDVFEFLRRSSNVYELTSPRRQASGLGLGSFRQHSGSSRLDGGQQQRKVLGGLSKAVLQSSHSVGRGLSSASTAVTGTVKQGVSELASAASGSVALVAGGVVGVTGAVAGGVAGAAGVVAGGVAGAAGAVKEALSGHPDEPQTTGLTRRVRSVPSGLDRAISSAGGGEGDAGGELAKRGNSVSAMQRQPKEKSGLLGKASTRLRQAMQREPSSQQQLLQSWAGDQLEPSGHSSSSSMAGGSDVVGDQLSGSPAKRASRLFSSLRRRSKSRSISPEKQPRPRSPTRKPRRAETGSGAGGGSAAGSRRNSGDLDDSSGLGTSLTGEVPPHLAASLAGASPSPGPPSPIYSFPVGPSLDMEDCAGISAPLYEMVDCVFQLQTRGFFRRQVFAVARQALSLVAGEAIDQYLTAKLRLLRQQHTIGRIIQRIQASLWPGGVWFQHTPAAQAQAAAAAAAKAAAGGGYVRPAGMDPAQFLTPGGPAPLDEDEIREAVEGLLLRRAPAALVRLIGKNAYASGMQDLFQMLQSPTFCFHIGYGCLEVALAHLFPELKPLFRTLQHGGLG